MKLNGIPTSTFGIGIPTNNLKRNFDLCRSRNVTKKGPQFFSANGSIRVLKSPLNADFKMGKFTCEANSKKCNVQQTIFPGNKCFGHNFVEELATKVNGPVLKLA
jgi:hypothetical protein